MPLAHLRLGWRWPRPNDFQTNDLRPLKDSFSSLQGSLFYPHVGLRFSGTFAMGTGFTASVVPMVVTPGPPDTGDPYSLYRSTTVHVQVPQEFDSWMMYGAVTFVTAGSASIPIRTLGFSINGAATENWLTHGYHNTAGGLRAVVPIMERVKKGDVIRVCAASTTAENLSTARTWLKFEPLG